MILAYAVIFFVVAAILLRRDVSRIGQLPYRGGWAAIILVGLLFALQARWAIYISEKTAWQGTVLILSQAGLVLLALVNRHLPGAKLFALGVFLNILVMTANGGWMPLTPQMYQFVYPDRTIAAGDKPFGSKNIILPESEINLWLLADIIPVTLPWRRTVVSTGDVVMMLAAAQFVFGGTATNKLAPPAIPPD